MESIIEIKNLSFRYQTDQEHYDVHNISFHVKRGEWLSIVGHNGSGKSTTVRLIDGLLEAESGEIWIDGDCLTPENVWGKRRQIGMVFQNPDNQFVGATVEDDVAFGLENQGIPLEEMKHRVAEALSLVGMAEFSKKEPARLSGGQKQRVAIAGVVALRPDILILDEATAYTDMENQNKIQDSLMALCKNKTLVVIAHRLTTVIDCDKIIVLDAGKLDSVGRHEELIETSALYKKMWSAYISETSKISENKEVGYAKNGL